MLRCVGFKQMYGLGGDIRGGLAGVGRPPPQGTHEGHPYGGGDTPPRPAPDSRHRRIYDLAGHPNDMGRGR